MLRPSLILSFIGLTAALSSGCDRANDVVEAESQHRGATLDPAVRANDSLRGCTATAKCPNGGTLSCEVPGDGTCSGINGVGVQCIT